MSRRPKENTDTIVATNKGGTVTVACKIPNGIVLQLCKPTQWFDETPSGTRERTRHDKYGPRVVVNGPAFPNGPPPEGFRNRPETVGGYALTSGIDADFFAKWMKQNKDAPYVTSGMIYAHSQATSVRAFAKEHKDTRSGFESLSQDMDFRKDPRIPAPVPGIAPVSKLNQDQDRPAAA